MSKKVNSIYQATFVLDAEQDKQVKSKWVALFDKDGNEVTSTDMCFLGYEDEDGEECDEDGNLLFED
jgi:hypothetical protein